MSSPRYAQINGEAKRACSDSLKHPPKIGENCRRPSGTQSNTGSRGLLTSRSSDEQQVKDKWSNHVRRTRAKLEIPVEVQAKEQGHLRVRGTKLPCLTQNKRERFLGARSNDIH